jgi:hypothetical protein
MLQFGTEITWQSQAAGVWEKKEGMVVCFVPKGENLNDTVIREKWHKLPVKKTIKSPTLDWFLNKLKTVPKASAQDRYLVWVPSKNRFYTPFKRVAERG